MWFRRGMLLMVGFLCCGSILARLCQGAQGFSQAAPVITPAQTAQPGPLAFPCIAVGSDLQVLGLVCYEGVYLEDGGVEEVASSAALVVKNTGNAMVESGTVVMKQEGNVLVFQVYALPPDGCALVLEKDAKPYSNGAVSACFGWDVDTAAQHNSVSVRETGPCTLCVTNSGSIRLEKIRILFKSWDPESGMYIGGIVYEANIASLLPGESVYISPYYYVSGYSRIVAIEIENAALPYGKAA